MQAPVALPRCFAEILCPDFGFGSLREFRPRCRNFTVIHQVLPQNCASSVRKIYSQITLVQLCGIALTPVSLYFLVWRKQKKQKPKKKKKKTKSDLLLEAHLLQYSQMAYGEEIEVSLFHYERPEVRFSGLDALKEQLKKDTLACVTYFEERGNDGKKEGFIEEKA